MVEIKIVNNKSELLLEIQSSFVPDVGEYIWLNNTFQNPDARKVTSRVIDIDKKTKNFIVTLIVE